MDNPKAKLIVRDGKNYEFTPGKFGSLIERVTRTKEPQSLVTPMVKRAKVLPMKLPPDVGATRG